MKTILTFIAGGNTPLTADMFDIVGDFADAKWLAKNKAADVTLNHSLNPAALTYIRQQLEAQEIDILITRAPENRRKKLLIADMDSTIVTGETLDDLAAFAGIKDHIAAITARAMNGELDFHAALRERVGLLKGLSTNALHETLKETKLMPGAKTLVQTMKKHGAKCILVSGGFTFFTSAIAEQADFDLHHGNILDIANEKLTGNVLEPILDKDSKLAYLQEYAATIGIENALTIGDGANDLPMLQAGGLGLGYHAKPSVTAQLANTIRFSDLTAALFAQGYHEKEFAITS